MAWYDVKFSCGHEDRVQLVGPDKDRARKIKFFEDEGMCPACYKAYMQAKKEAERVEKTAGIELVELEGTPKQVAWAEDIRANFFDSLKGKKWNESNPQEMALKAAAIELFSSKASAKWWIDSRDKRFAIIMHEHIEQLFEMAGLEMPKR